MSSPGTVSWTVGAIEVTRVADPDFELVLPQDERTAAVLKATPWLCPDFVTDEQALLVGSSAVAVRTPSALIVVDPFLAFDDPARLAPRLAALRSAGVDPDEVDLVVNTHVDGIGANVLVDGSPAFTRARYLLPDAELVDLRSGAHGEVGAALLRLADTGRLGGVGDDETLVPGVRVRSAPGHNRGHVAVWVGSAASQAVIVGHLFLHPAQIANPDVDTGDLDPALVARTRRTVLQRCVRDDVLLIGPLFAPPGAGKVRQDGTGWRLQPVWD
jgi:glyoxylase-like metal-dependent hydrolase (beta-lactamase superfamily II)